MASAPTRLSIVTTCSQGEGWRGRTLSTWSKVGQSGSGTKEWAGFLGQETSVHLH